MFRDFSLIHGFCFVFCLCIQNLCIPLIPNHALIPGLDSRIKYIIANVEKLVEELKGILLLSPIPLIFVRVLQKQELSYHPISNGRSST
jgi:hypothetical protein